MIMYIAKRNPWDWASAAQLQALRDIFGEKEVLVVDLLNPKQEQRECYLSYGKYRGPIDRILRSAQGNVASISNEIIKDICRIIEREKIEIIYSAESDLGNLFRQIKTEFPTVRTICFYHDIGADLYAQWRHQCSWKKPYRKLLEYNIAIHQERVLQKYVDDVWVFNAADAERFQNHYGHVPDAIIPMSADSPRMSESDFQLIKGAKEEKTILFICSTYYVNILGFRWFYRNVLARLHEHFRLIIPGRGANSLKEEIQDDRIEIIGPVDSMDPYYREADIVITPIFDGGGMKSKDVEAISYGKCVLSTHESFHGIWEHAPDTIKNRTLFCSDDAIEWAAILNRLLASEINTHDREEYEWFCANYSYDALLNRFKELLVN